ncbi:MAG: DNRLRE domain-containing protein [Firmicutes bacterium]|nr:DNRLRE domain-containing protein [Bacillota bacterium]
MKEIEIKEKRGRKVKQYLHRDGTITAKVFCDDIHFMKNGIYEEIDNTLVKEKDYYVNKDNDYKAYFYKKTKDSLIRIEKDKYFLNIKLDNCNDVEIDINKNKSKLRSELIYRNILDNIDFKYNITPNKVKETIILNNKNNLLEKIVFILESDLELILENKEIWAKDNDNIVFKFEVPYMYDSDNLENKNVYYNLFKKDNCYILELNLDIAWLKEERKYPVYIDPTITNFYEDGTVYDTYISSNEVNINKGNQDILKCGVERINGVDVVHRTLLKFDLPPISTGDEIIDAHLNLWGYPSNDNTLGGDYVSIHRITQEWDELSATWANMNDKYNSRVESLYDACRSVIGLDGYLDFGFCTMYGDITDLVKKWYVDLPNNGILLKAAKEVYKDENYPSFYSKNNTIDGGENIQPTLVITYRNQNGLEDYLDYMRQSFSIGSTNVNTYNGNLVGVFDLGSTIGGKLPASVNLVYNTNDVVLENDTIFGRGYKLSLDQKIEIDTLDEESCLKYHDEDGTIHYFFKKYEYDEEGNLLESNMYCDEDGLDLVIDVSDTNYIMIDKNGNKMTFIINEGIGYLSEVEDISHNKIIINRNIENNIVKIIDANEAEINFIYEDNLIKVISPDSTTELNYEDGLLKSIVNLEGITSFSYNTNKIITNITDITGLKINYEYYDKVPYRIKKVTQYGLNNSIGNYFSLNYEFNSTTITDNLGRTNTLIFNSIGNLISKNSLSSSNDISNAYSVTHEYGNDFYAKNKIIEKIVPVKYIKNYLNNTSFEEDIDNFNITSSLVKSYDTENVKTGNRSLKIVSSGDNQYIDKTIVIEKGNFYTFSGYFKNDKDITISLSYLDNDNNMVEEKQIKNISNDFEREDVTIYYPENSASDLCIKIYVEDASVTYIDDIQLEEGEVANNYNMIENSDFSLGLTDWTLSAGDAESGDSDILYDPEDYFSVVKVNNNKNYALKIKMEPYNHTSFIKTLPVNGKMGDLFHLSFWYKNEGIYLDSVESSNSVYLMWNPTNELYATEIMQVQTLPVNLNYWQYFSCTFVAEYDYEGLEVRFNQSRNANDFYITNLSLYKDVATENYSYDDNGNLVYQGNSNDDVSSFNYDSNNELIKATDPKGKNFRFEYDNNHTNRVLSAISSMGITNQVKYDSFGNPIMTKISKKANEELVNGNYKIRSKGTDKYLKMENSRSLIVSSNSCSNPVWTLEKVDDYFKVNSAEMLNYSLSFNNDIALLNNNNLNNLYTLELNDNGSYYIKKSTEDKFLKVDENNKVLFSSLVMNDPSFEFYFESLEDLFIESSSTYTTDGRFVSSVTDSNFNTSTYETDPITGLVTGVTNAKGISTNYSYNDKQQLTSVTTDNRSVNYSYNSNNLLYKITQGNKEYNFIYDEFLNSKKTMIGENITLVENEYEENNGNLYKSIYGNNHEITFDYDSFDRIKILHKMDNDYHYKYDNNGNIAKILSNNHKEKFKYDIKNRIDEYTYDDFKIKYKYDSNDNIINKEHKLDDNSLIIENTFDKDDQLTKMILDNKEINYEYDGLGRLINKNINNSFNTEYEYVSNGKRTSDLIKSIKNGDNKFSYKYDKLNNITDIYYNNNLIKKYYYDDINELIKEEDLEENKKTEYIYDNNGNILTKVISNMEDNSIISTDTYTYGNNNWEDQLTKFNNQDITYDMIGNPLTIGNDINLTWINGRSLNSYQDTSKNLNITYKYNQDGIRISKIINDSDIKYYLEEKRIIYEQRGNNLIHYLYDSTGILGLVYNNNEYYYIKNLQGDIIGLLNSNYEQIVSYEYDSWGKVLSIKDNEGNIITDNNNIGIINPFRYRGYYYDEETSLYYLNSRYYNPVWGRFVNADGILGANKDILSCNLYSYVSNNSVNFKDDIGDISSVAILIPVGIEISKAAVASVLKNTILFISIAFAGYGGYSSDLSKQKEKSNSNKGEHNVYVLADKKSGKVEYVGRTKKLSSAQSRHNANPARKDLVFTPVAQNVDKNTARGLEQIFIYECRTLNRGTPMHNQINGISPRNLNFQLYWDAALVWASGDENLVACNVDFNTMKLRR